MEKRLDILLVEKGLAGSRERAKELITAGQVKVENKTASKASQQVEETAEIRIEGETLRYVGRGGLKMEKAVEVFGLDLKGKVCLDIGASTGGFTDCMLQNGASHVFSIDVGRDQLAASLREDPRVTNMEQTNVRYLTLKQLTERGTDGPADLAAMDVSFISLTKVLDAVSGLVKENGEIVCLIKPQFEAGRGAVGKKGVVKDPNVHREVIRMVLSYARGLSLQPEGLTYSPIRGPEGNIEYLLYLRKMPSGTVLTENADPGPKTDINFVVKEAHRGL